MRDASKLRVRRVGRGAYAVFYGSSKIGTYRGAGSEDRAVIHAEGIEKGILLGRAFRSRALGRIK